MIAISLKRVFPTILCPFLTAGLTYRISDKDYPGVFLDNTSYIYLDKTSNRLHVRMSSDFDDTA